ncbi:GNAT family N-acetyltransferase [Sporolactobacillus laevolacticus]|uniref:GNAT family N-acetyltransferase n=1 Tax=Sporolactobacillus laevolacticus TaxID=33018 RepID=UPI0025B3C988|nr:GNAT family N-acetyltransferase [Sporolactobacillus laevolacticus]MDN3956563.1 GNAT family N-acetyltransferase [Sporolactobacillus laevolacticus]
MTSELTHIKIQDFDLVYELMNHSFPSIEFRPRDKQFELLKRPNFTIYARYNSSDQTLDGFIAEWSFADFCFVEHFAVQPYLRGHGVGSEMMRQYLNQAKKQVLIEVEEPVTDLAIRRIHFYQRLGFVFSAFGYIQPDLRNSGEKEVTLRMMNYPTPLTKPEFLQRKKEIFQQVYGMDQAEQC